MRQIYVPWNLIIFKKTQTEAETETEANKDKTLDQFDSRKHKQIQNC